MNHTTTVPSVCRQSISPLLSPLKSLGEVTPWPVKGLVWGLPKEELVTVSVPDLVPALVGVKVTGRLHDAPAFRVVGQVPALEKSPLTSMLEIVSGAFPRLRIKMFVEGVVVLRIRVSNLTGDVPRLSTGPTPNPTRLMV